MPADARTAIWKRCRDAMAGLVTVRGVVLGIALLALLALLPRLSGVQSIDFIRAVQGQPDAIDLTRLITTVKQQLYKAERGAIDRGEVPLLVLKEVELEVVFVVQVKNNTEVQLVPVNLALATELGQTQRVKLRLAPIEPEPASVPAQSAAVIEAGSAPVTGPTPPPARVPAHRPAR